MLKKTGLGEGVEKRQGASAEKPSEITVVDKIYSKKDKPVSIAAGKSVVVSCVKDTTIGKEVGDI